MKENFDYNEVPQGYIHCLNEQCSLSSDCLRFKVTAFAGKEIKYFPIVNPKYSDEQEACYFFHPDRLIRYASGITHLYDNLPHTKYAKIKKMIYNHFGHSYYYRIYNKQRLIKPKDQDFIRELFIKEEIGSEPVFDQYIEKYDFFPA